ncbi:relaxase family protein [Hymenobacter tenuis]
MIAKTSIGSDFTGALEYGAGLRSDRTNKQSELLSVSNVGSVDAHGIAAEMRAVAELSGRIQKPVWHTSLSWAPGEQVSREQKLRAAALYCELMGASLDRHQVAVYEHKDKAHPHIHVYINRVPTDGGPALDTAQNYARNVKATQQIREQLGLQPLPDWPIGTRSHIPEREAARQFVNQTLTEALRTGRARSLKQLAVYLQGQGIEAAFKQDSQGLLVGTSFRYQDHNIKGTEAGYKAKQLRDYFNWLSTTTPAQVVAAPALTSGSFGSAHPETHPAPPSLLDAPGLGLLNGRGADDAERNENVLRRRRRRLKL